MTPEHLGAIIRLYDPNPEWRDWTDTALAAIIEVGGNRVALSHNGRGKERVRVTLGSEALRPMPIYFDDALELMAYLERLRE